MGLVLLEDNKGFTLIEALASLTILSIIIILLGSVQVFGNKQYVNQYDFVENQTNIRYVVTLITKEIRSVNEVSVNSNIITIGTNEYRLTNETIWKNDQPIVTNIHKFDVKQNGNNISLEIESVPNNQGNAASVTTEIFLRK